jgi:iron complex transport system ATP-binding protein
MDRVGLGRLMGRDARDLSLGERQLVLVAVAIAQAAPIVLLDEPTVHLDIRHQVEVMDLLVDLNERDGTTVVAVLHDLNLAVRYFPRIVLLANGRIEADGAPREVLSADRIGDVFGIDPAILPIGPWSRRESRDRA